MRKATSMIELVIAIVVMGIAVMSLPLILTQSQNSNALALQQEAIMATKTQLAYILSYEWDENSFDANASTSRVLVTNSDNDLNATDIRRNGHVEGEKRRRLWDTSASNTQRSPDSEILGKNDIDDFNNYSETVAIASQNMDYIFTLELNTSVRYFTDTATYGDENLTDFSFDYASATPGNPSNIKMIAVTARDLPNRNSLNITLRAFASNIGESGILKKVYK